MKEDKKVRLQRKERESEAEQVLKLGKPISSLNLFEVTTLLKWHEVPKATMGKLSDKREKWTSILRNGTAPPSYCKCTAEDDAALAKLEAEPVSIKETALGRLKEQHKKELLATLRAMGPEEKAEFLREVNSGGNRNSNPVNEGKEEEDEGDEGKTGSV